MNHSYKREHEEFVSGHGGTSFQETSSVFVTAAAVCLLRDGLAFRLLPTQSKTKTPATSSKPFFSRRFVSDFVILVIPNLLNVTLLSAHVTGNLLAIITISCITLLYLIVNESKSATFSSSLKEINLGERKSFVTNFRSMVNLLTAICILAVDFRIFPRRFAKAETYGYGLMDAGVGFFVVSNAIVSPEARSKTSLLSWKHQLRKAFLSSLPLIVLGVARLLSVKGVDYHEHVSEYGVHWNFFFTLAALKIFSCVTFLLLPKTNPLILGSVITALHQLCLSLGLSDYVVKGADGHGGRQGVIDANREGFISLPGYLAIYMISVQLGKFLFWKRGSVKEWFLAVLHLCTFFTISTVLMCGVNELVQPVSRRFSNASYVFYVVGQSCLILMVTLLGEICKTCLAYMKTHKISSINMNPVDIGGKETLSDRTGTEIDGASPMFGRRNLHESESKPITNVHSQDNFDHSLLDAISFNSLLFFLLANVLTGLINMTLSTIHLSHMTAISVLLCYLLTLCLTMSVLHEKGIVTKVW